VADVLGMTKSERQVMVNALFEFFQDARRISARSTTGEK
jgi:hypothetical protein